MRRKFRGIWVAIAASLAGALSYPAAAAPVGTGRLFTGDDIVAATAVLGDELAPFVARATATVVLTRTGDSWTVFVRRCETGGLCTDAEAAADVALDGRTWTVRATTALGEVNLRSSKLARVIGEPCVDADNGSGYAVTGSDHYIVYTSGSIGSETIRYDYCGDAVTDASLLLVAR